MSTAQTSSPSPPSGRSGPARAQTPRTRSIFRPGIAALGAAVVTATALVVASGPAPAQASGSTLFTALGETQTATIPAGALGAFFLVDGGGGGQGFNGLGKATPGGAGASVTGTLLLAPDDVLTIDVGSQGASAPFPVENPAPAWGGDAPGGTSYGSDTTVGGGGGGASSVLLNGDDQLMAGGGGGGGGSGTLGGIDAGGDGGVAGGNGTGTNGKDGSGPGHGHGGAFGGESGMAGGAGAPEHHDAGPGGGGGGGWKGGNGGTGGGTGGGGGGGGGAGSSYLGSAVMQGGTITTAPEAADGQVVITWIFSPVCLETFTQTVSATEPMQFPLPCSFQGVPGTQITFGIAEHGTLSVVDVSDGTIEYTPDQAGWTGTDQFTYTITNANGATATGSISTLNQGNWAQPQLSSPTANPGDQVDVTASGLKPGEQVQLRLHSDPVMLKDDQAGADGTLHTTVTIPEEADLGDHHIEVLSETSGSRLVPITLASTAEDSETSTGTAQDTGHDRTPWGAIALAGGIAVLAIGTIIALATRGRRQDPDHPITT